MNHEAHYGSRSLPEHELDGPYDFAVSQAGAISRYNKNQPVDLIDPHREEAVLPYIDAQEFKVQFEDITGLHPGILDPKEIYYLNNLFAHTDKEFKDRLKVFYQKHDLPALNLAIATEYHPSLLYHFMILEEQVGEDVDGLQDMLFLFENTYSLIKNISEDIALKVNKESNGEYFSLQIFEALLRKEVDLIELWQRSFTSNQSRFSAEEIAAAMKMYHSALFTIYDFFSESPVGTIKAMELKSGQMPKFSYTDISGKEAHIKFFCRPKDNTDGQARMSLEIDFDTENPMAEQRDFFAQHTQRLKDGEVIKSQDEHVFRMSFDRDTTHENPHVSLDIGRGAYQGQKMNRTGDRLGNMFAAASKEGSHTPYSFDPIFAEEEKFESMAVGFSQYISDLHAKVSQTMHQM